jgi:hypothetical protein
MRSAHPIEILDASMLGVAERGAAKKPTPSLPAGTQRRRQDEVVYFRGL